MPRVMCNRPKASIMKKVFRLAAVVLFILSGCVTTQSPIQGSLVSTVSVPGAISLPEAGSRIVEGKATATGILGIVRGDCSYEAALRDALTRSGARALKNIVVDHQVKNIIFIYAEYTTVVRGTPIR